ncbi:MAG: hypothetical protein R3C41_16435 [Calditrichia bacterium]|nr:hypothetical protein [Calditrichota bacterium]MCB0267778.1 hypothetical protein [Calditrichota bacterium]MCB0285721.1 hypothetical protein [Calditrichota bacterium]MCB9067343.1 hypothetical protein [Calditrichia bacterium]
MIAKIQSSMDGYKKFELLSDSDIIPMIYLVNVYHFPYSREGKTFTTVLNQLFTGFIHQQTVQAIE